MSVCVRVRKNETETETHNRQAGTLRHISSPLSIVFTFLVRRLNNEKKVI